VVIYCVTQFKLKRQRAPEIDVVSRHGITPEHGNQLIYVTPTLLGEEIHRAKRAGVVLLPSPVPG
jgi:hypothetical protein